MSRPLENPLLAIAPALLMLSMLVSCGEPEFGELDYDPSDSCRLLERETRLVVDVNRSGAVGEVWVEVYEDATVSCGSSGARVTTPGEAVDAFALEGADFERRYTARFTRPVVAPGEDDAEPDVSAKAYNVIAFADLNGNRLCDSREPAGSVTVTSAARATLALDRICPIGRR